jgi:hypothetical protein
VVDVDSRPAAGGEVGEVVPRMALHQSPEVVADRREHMQLTDAVAWSVCPGGGTRGKEVTVK